MWIIIPFNDFFSIIVVLYVQSISVDTRINGSFYVRNSIRVLLQ